MIDTRTWQHALAAAGLEVVDFGPAVAAGWYAIDIVCPGASVRIAGGKPASRGDVLNVRITAAGEGRFNAWVHGQGHANQSMERVISLLVVARSLLTTDVIKTNI